MFFDREANYGAIYDCDVEAKLAIATEYCTGI
jgi:hypothetical protein